MKNLIFLSFLSGFLWVIPVAFLIIGIYSLVRYREDNTREIALIASIACFICGIGSIIWMFSDRAA